MKKIVVMAVLPLLLSACGPQADVTTETAAVHPTPPVDAAAVAASAPAGPVAAEPGDTGMDILAGRGIEVPFPYAVNYDIKDVSKNGTPRRRVLLEILDGSFEDSAAAFEAVLADDGYALTDATSDDGKLQRTYVKSGSPTYYLLMQSWQVGPPLSYPAAVGSVHVMWNDR